MSKLRFDPVTYQFYYRCSLEDGGPAKAAGFRWDALRRRYYTVEPKTAAALASRGDSYVRLLLVDALGAGVSSKHTKADARSKRWTLQIRSSAILSNTIH